MLNLDPLRRDVDLILSVLELNRAGGSQKCIIHGGRDSLSLRERDGIWFFKCFSCGASGDVLDALALIRKCTPADLIMELRERKKLQVGNRLIRLDDIAQAQYAPKPKPRPPPPAQENKNLVPVPDMQRLGAFLLRGQEELLNNFDAIMGKWRRNISRSVAEQYGLGFRSSYKLREDGEIVDNCWIIPITNTEGEIKGIKLHRENVPKGIWKTKWATFGTVIPEGEKSVRHSYHTIWPPPEWFNLREDEWIFLNGGELKALAFLSLPPIGGDAFGACSPTQGEGYRWKDGGARRFKGRNVCVVWDDDPPKARHDGTPFYPGVEFRDASIEALLPYARRLKTMTFGRMSQPLDGTLLSDG